MEVSKAAPISSRKTHHEMASTKPGIRHVAKSAVLGMVFVEAVRIVDGLVLLSGKISD
jgi:hypothetical protein